MPEVPSSSIASSAIASASVPGAGDLVIRTLVELADTLVEEFDVVDLLSLLTDRCVEAFNVHDAGLMLAVPVGGDLRVMVSTSAAMRDVELYELQTRDGPCLDAYSSGRAVRNMDLSDTVDRWPLFTPKALMAGFRSVSALPMRLRGTTIGALNLFRNDRTLMSELELVAAQAFADVATIAVLHHQQVLDIQVINEQLTHALNSRVIVEQAKGMLAERANLEMNDAMDWFRRYARSSNLRLVEVAERFIDGRLTTDALSSSAPAG